MELLKLLSTRIRYILLSTICIFGLIVFCLFQLQITNMQRFYELSQRNFLRKEKTASPRGNITDAEDILLATNRPFYTLQWQGTGERTLTPRQRDILTTLCETLSSKKQSIIPSYVTDEFARTILQAEKRSNKYMLASDITLEELSRILERWPHEKNISIEKNYKRNYPYGTLAAHIVGYLGIDKDTAGKMGLEMIHNKALKGHSGKILKVINSVGRHLQAHKVSNALAGKTIQTTLNFNFQKAAEELFPEDTEGCLLLMDESGALEVVLSRPSFDPNIFLRRLSISEWESIQKKKGLLNRAFNSCYPPASLFKLVTLAASLETGIISQDTRWHCIGHTEFKGRRYRCGHQEGHGVLCTQQALAHSCNIPFYEMGKKLKIDTLAHYAHIFGLGEKTGIIFPEKGGLIPTAAWKRRVRHEPWYPGETLSAVIGQSCILVTELQIARMINAICTGYRVRPRILADEVIVKEPLEIKKETRQFLDQCLQSVIKQGTAHNLKHLANFKIKGKTGTAQVQSLDKEVLRKENLHHGYFAAHFQYKNEKPRTLVILLEHAGSSSVATKVAVQFLKRFAQIVDKPQDHSTVH